MRLVAYMLLGAALIAGALLVAGAPPAKADTPAPATATATGSPTAATVAPVCTWPDKGVPLTLSIGQVQVVQAWANGQDYSHVIWATIAPTLIPQFNSLSKEYCK